MNDLYFELPHIDENFVSGLSTLDTSKATGLGGVGPRFLKLSFGIIIIRYYYQKFNCYC